MTSQVLPLEELPARDNVQPELSALPPKNTYFEFSRQTEQPWPERPRALDLKRTSKRRKDLVVLPEMNVPLQEVFYGRDGTLKFSRSFSNIICLRLHESMDKIRKTKEAGGIPYVFKKIQSKYRKVTKYSKPSLNSIQLPFNDKRKNSTANIQFPECILEPEDFTWDTPGKRLGIASSAAEKMMENAILWIDEKHWVLKSFKHLSCAPKEKFPYDRRDSYKRINILLHHITNGRWIWITSVKPVSQTMYMLPAKVPPTPREKNELRVHINIAQTNSLHDARMAFFAFRTADPKAALRQFCNNGTVDVKILMLLFECRLTLSFLLANPSNARIMENVGKRLPLQMEKYWKIQCKDPSELEILVKSYSAPNPRRLSNLFRPSLRRIRTDPEELRMATKHLSIEKETPRCPFGKCSDIAYCDAQKAMARKKEVKRIVFKAIFEYLRDKKLHHESCHACFWDHPKECRTHSKRKLNSKSKQRASRCRRCELHASIDHTKKIEILNQILDEKAGLRPEDLATTKEIMLLWNSEHQADAPEGWCCHGDSVCNDACKEEHRKYKACDGKTCLVELITYGPYKWFNPATGKKQEVMVHKRTILPHHRMRVVPIVKIRDVEEEEDARESVSAQSGVRTATTTTPASTVSTTTTTTALFTATPDNVQRKRFWNTLRRWTKSRKDKKANSQLAAYQSRLQV